MKMKYETLLIDKEGGVTTVTINRPKNMNAMTRQLVDELLQVTEEIGKDDETKVAIITGAGEEAFCTGADLKSPMLEWKDQIDCLQYLRVHPLFTLNIRKAPKPVIAAVNGVAAGGGCGLALSCDIRIASEKARFRPSFGAIGLFPETGITHMLPNLIGISRAMEIMLTARVIDAREAERIGLVTKVVPPAELLPTTKELAHRLAQGPALVISMLKPALYEGVVGDLSAAIEREAITQAVLVYTEDFKEGVSALLGKRKPLFKGR